MTLGDPLTRFRTVDFFGVFLPGLYVVASFGYCWAAATAKDAGALQQKLIAHFTSDAPSWYGVAVVILVAFLIGSVIRAFPVHTVDGRLGTVARRFLGKDAGARRRWLYEDDFPYFPLLQYEWKQLANAGCLSRLNAMPPWDMGHPHIAFDFCKEYVAMKNRDAAANIEVVEARTRMFYGLFWATAGGMLVSVLGTLLSFLFASGGRFFPLTWSVVCLFLGTLLAHRLRFIRAYEARIVFYAYLIQRESELASKTAAASSGTSEESHLTAKRV